MTIFIFPLQPQLQILLHHEKKQNKMKIEKKKAAQRPTTSLSTPTTYSDKCTKKQIIHVLSDCEDWIFGKTISLISTLWPIKHKPAGVTYNSRTKFFTKIGPITRVHKVRLSANFLLFHCPWRRSRILLVGRLLSGIQTTRMLFASLTSDPKFQLCNSWLLMFTDNVSLAVLALTCNGFPGTSTLVPTILAS